jgi:HAE1 family hydrophobic/amphiphilic exporter-1
VFAVMLILALVVAGSASYLNLGVARYPRLDTPTVFLVTTYPGASPQEMESEISQVLEDAVATVEGIDELRSISGEGNAFIILTFHIDRDIDAAAQDVRDAVGSVLARLPRGTDPPMLFKRDTDSSPIMSLAVSGPRDSRELYVLADHYVKQIIEGARGVGEVLITGAMDRAVQVNIDAQRLAAYELSIIQVREALARQNAEVPGGLVQGGVRERTLRTLGRLDHVRDFEDLVVATVNETAVRLRDLGEVLDTQKETRTLARLDGTPAVVLQVQRQTGANTVEVIDAVKERLARSRQLLPTDVKVDVIQDQSRYIHAAMHEMQKHLIAGSLLASLVVLVFMRSWRSALIAAIAIPASLVSTFAMMQALDFTLNNVTMLALVLMVGVVIDDAVIVLENIFHAIEEKRMAPLQAAIHGTREIGLAVLATTMSLIIVFLPVSFLSSVTGRMLFEFGLTATVAMLVSMLLSFSLTPMMCSRLLRAPERTDGPPASRRGFYHWIEVGYAYTLRWAMRHRWLVCLISLAVIASNVPLYRLVDQDYIPTNVDESEFEARLQAPDGTSIASMNEAMQTIEARLLGIHGVQHVLTIVGQRGRVNSAEIYIGLDDIQTRTFSLSRLLRETWAGRPRATFAGNYTQQEKMYEVRQILGDYPELQASVRNLTSFRQGAPVDIDFSVTGPNLEDLYAFGQRLLKKAQDLPGIVDTDLTLKMDKPELLVHIDRERAASLGVDVQEIAETLRVAVGGDDRVSRYRDQVVDDAYDVELRLVGIDRGDPAVISQLYVRANFLETSSRQLSRRGQGQIRLDNVVTFDLTETASRIDRLNRERMVSLRANVAPGYALSDRISAIRQAADELGIPAGFNATVLGRGKELERLMRDFAWTFILSFIFMYIVLAAQFEHLVHPITILISLPLAVPFGLVSLWLGGETLNLYSALGILVLFGVVKKASILQVDHTNQLRALGMNRDSAILQANRDRLRPILMTTIAFVAGLFPLLIATGPGAEERRSIAVLAVGGQTLSLLLTLLAVPVVYSVLDDLAAVFRRQPQAARVLPVPHALKSLPEPVAHAIGRTMAPGVTTADATVESRR